MKRLWDTIFTMRFAAAVTLASFFPSAVNAQQLFWSPVVAAVAASQTAEDTEQTSPTPPAQRAKSESSTQHDDAGANLKRALPEPFKLAQATTEPSPAPAPTLNPDAQAMLDEAAAYESGGDPVNATLTLFNVMESYPNSAEAYVALRELTRFAENLLDGAFPEPLVLAFESVMPTYDQCTGPESRYIVSAYFYYRAQQKKENGLTTEAETYFDRAYDLAWRFVSDFPQNPLTLVVLQQLIASALALGPGTARITAESLADDIHGAPLTFNTWATRAVLGSYYHETNNKPQLLVAFQEMIDQTAAAGIDQVLADPNVWPYLKVQILYYCGRAYMGKGNFANALPYFQRIYDEYPGEGTMSELSTLMRADAIDHLYPDDPDQAILALQKVLDRYPQGKYAGPAKYFMAGIYSRWENYDYAVSLLDDIATNHPNSRVAPRANNGVTYILSEQWDGTPIARAGDPGTLQFAQVCGPTALQHLLAMKGIDSTVAELAALAGTDSRGTSMLALAKAASRKGLELQGVRATTASDIATPYIAYVNGNHFVVVEDVTDGVVTITDMKKPSQEMSAESFSKMWAGDALVLKNSPFRLASVLDEESLANAVGGLGDVDFDCSAAASEGVPCSGPDQPDGEKYDKPGCDGDNADGSGGDPSDGNKGGGCPPSDDGDPANDENPDAPGGDGPGDAAECGDPGAGTDALRIKPLGVFGGGLRAGMTPSTSWKVGGRASGLYVGGISGSIGALESSQRFHQRDLYLKTVGGLYINFSRNFENPKGLARGYFTAQDAPFQDNIGKNWTHSLNMHLLTGTLDPPGSVSLVNGSGTALQFDLDSSDATWNYYKRGNRCLKRNKTSHIFILEYPNSFEYEFSAQSSGGRARIEKIRDKTGNQTTFHYNSANVDTGYLTKVSTPGSDGRYMLLQYASNRITKASVKSSGGSTLQYVSYNYAADGTMTKFARDGETNGIKYAYTQPASPSGAIYVNKITDRTSTDYTFQLDYDSTAATKVNVIYPSGLETRHLRSTVDGSVTTRDRRVSSSTVFAKTRWIPNSNGQITDKQYFSAPTDTTPAATHKFSYASNMRLTKYESPMSSVGQFVYTRDSNNRVISKRMGSTSGDPLWTYSYDSSGCPASQSPTKITYPDGTSTELFYDSYGRTTKIIRPQHGSSQGIRYFYNSLGQITKITDPLNADWLYEYDSMGNVTKTKNPLNEQVTLQYDQLNRVTKIVDPMSNETVFEYSSGGCGSCGTTGNITKVRRAYGAGPSYRDVQYQYNANNRVTKVIDPAGHALDLSYDSQNRLTKTTYPSGANGKSTTLVYNELDQATQVTDAKSNTRYFAYDYGGRVTSITDAVDSVTMAYDDFGNLTSVTDGNSHTWTYAYGAYHRLTKITDPSAKYLVYAYDTMGRVTSVGAGSSGTVQPITYAYSTGSAGTGHLTHITYGAGGFSAFEYDATGRLSTLNDNIKQYFSIPKLQYSYDAAGRLTRLYDGTDSFYYYYNDSGIVTKQSDWAGRDTTYTYDDLYQLTGLTYLSGTGNAKSWSFAYGSAGQKESITAPNGMFTDYVYDSDGILTDILHKSGATVKQGFSYLYDDVYNITKLTQEDGSYWTYTYDGRYRLSTAARHNSGDTIQASYAYTYDDGDNLITKVEPWVDDFSDTSLTDDGWSVSGTWSALSKYAENTADSGGWRHIRVSTSDLDTEVRGTYTITDNGASSPMAAIQPRLDTTSGKRLAVFFETSQARLREYDGSSWSTLDTNSSAGSSLDTAYAYRIISDGTDVEVWQGTPGAQMTKILETSSAATDLSSNTDIRFMVSPGAVVQYDDVMILASGLSRTSTFSVANNNELSSASDYNGATSYSYDAWGRMSTESKNGVTRTYSWTMANQLAGVNSSDANETDVAYWYTGDLKRLWRFEDGVLANSYKWDAGFNVDEETYWSGGSPTGTKAYAANLAEVDVTSTPSYSYRTGDHLGSTRGMWDGNKNQLGSWEYTPYGSPYLFGGPSDVTQLFTGHDLDPFTGQYYAPYRYLDTTTGRWLKRDPLAMIDGTNVYRYVASNPVSYVDEDGAFAVMALLGLAAVTAVVAGAVSSAVYSWYTAGLEADLAIQEGNIDRWAQRNIPNDEDLPPAYNLNRQCYINDLKNGRIGKILNWGVQTAYAPTGAKAAVDVHRLVYEPKPPLPPRPPMPPTTSEGLIPPKNLTSWK